MTVTFVFPTNLGVVIEFPFDPQPVVIPATTARVRMNAWGENREEEPGRNVAPNMEASSRSHPNVDGGRTEQLGSKSFSSNSKLTNDWRTL
jgi:hypothetical protein